MPIDKDADEALDSVFASDRDRGADSAAPEKEAPPPLEPKQEAETPKEDQQPTEGDSSKQYRDPETGRFVPLTELKTEREKRQEEARLRAEAERRAVALEAQLEEARRYWANQQQTTSAQQKQAAPEPPDPYVDPEGYFRFMEAQRQEREFHTRVHLSEELMRSRHSDYDAAEEAFRRVAVNDPSLVRQLASHPVPAKFAYEVGKRILANNRIGPDPDAFEKRIREEERQKVIAELKAGPKTTQRFPGTLADSMAASEQGSAQSDEAMLGDVFSSTRRVRKRSG